MSQSDKPNIVLLMADQFRADCLSIERHPVVQTPWLDSIAGAGVRCARAYSACPVCVPARRTLMTGTRPRTHSVFNHAPLISPPGMPTLAAVLQDAGYQTHRVGKLHISGDEYDPAHGFATIGDFGPHSRGLSDTDLALYGRIDGTQGASKNGWIVRPWPFPDYLHPAKRQTDQALDFLEHRDQARPFFLNVSYLEPHPPLLPPRDLFDHYLGMDLPDPAVGNWARIYDQPQHGLSPEACRVFLSPMQQKRYQAAYYAQIHHLDHEIGRILYQIRRTLGDNTIVMFCSDHGEMLGDHQWTRKQTPYESSAHIPWLMQFPASMSIAAGQVCEQPVELMDVMPTLLDAAGVAIPPSVEGVSLMALLRGEQVAWRAYVHGECSNMGGQGTGMQYLTDGIHKYVWLPGWGVEQFFDLSSDPQERVNLADDPRWQTTIDHWRQRLIGELTGRPEAFTDGRQLNRLAGATPSIMSQET